MTPRGSRSTHGLEGGGLIKQLDPGVSWLVNARKDLVAAYDTLGEPQKGARFRAELADTVRKAAAPVKGN